MLADILERNLALILVGTALIEASDELGFYHLGPRNQLWFLLEYAGITPTPIFTEAERKVLVNAKKDNVLNDMYKQLFFQKKESALLKHRIGITDLNRRRVVKNEDDPDAQPTSEDVQRFVKQIDKHRPRVVAFLTKPEVFEKCFKPLYPMANQQRGKQGFLISDSEVWLVGITSVRKDSDALEQVFEEIAGRLVASRLNHDL